MPNDLQATDVRAIMAAFTTLRRYNALAPTRPMVLRIEGPYSDAPRWVASVFVEGNLVRPEYDAYAETIEAAVGSVMQAWKKGRQ